MRNYAKVAWILLLLSLSYLAVPPAHAATQVGGIISSDTTWTKANSPYVIAQTVQIPSGVTLTIEPGVVIASRKTDWPLLDMFLLNGVIVAHGTPDSRIVFDGGGSSNFFNSKSSDKNTFLDLDYCVIRNGRSFWPPSGYQQYGSFSLRHSVLISLDSDSYVWYPKKDVYVEYNIFINTAGFEVFTGEANVYVRNNLFKKNIDVLFETWAIDSGAGVIVKYNSFTDTRGVVLRLPPGYRSPVMIASENYWGTTNTEIIDSMIYDKKDDITCAGFIEYLPILSTHHPDTAVLYSAATTPPTISITSPLNGSETRSTTVTVTWTGSDEALGISHYEIRLDRGSWTNVGANTTYLYKELSDGSHMIDVRATNWAGTTGQSMVSIGVNTSPLFGPGYTEEAAIIAIVFVVGLVTAIYRIKIRKRSVK